MNYEFIFIMNNHRMRYEEKNDIQAEIYFYRSSVESRTFHLSRFHLQTNFIKFHINEDIRTNAVENIFVVAIESLLKKCRSRNHQITFIFTIRHIPRCFHSICIIRTFPLPRHFNFDISIQFTSNIRLSWGTEAVISAGSYRIIISIYSDRCQKNCECEEMKNFLFQLVHKWCWKLKVFNE